MGVLATMALKAVLLLATVALVSSQMSSCNTDDRDCRCADKSFKECQEPVTADMIHVADLAECKFQCDLCNGCASCAADACGLLVETECTIANSEVTTTTAIPTVEGCRSVTTSQGNANNINFFIFDQRAEICWGYDSGKRSCSNVVAAQTMDQATIDSCRA